MALITGWDRSTWNSGAWNSPSPVEVTGVPAASAVGSATIIEGTGVTFSVTGVSAASAIGTATATGASNVSVTGVSAASAVGTATPLIITLVGVTGVSAASAIGSPTLIANSILSPSGVSAASAIGSVQINFSFSVEGVSAAGLANTVLIWDQIDDSQTPNWTQIAA